jgi:inorganic triphosphatase YgiF
LYIVLNKADRKSEDSYQDVLDAVADTLSDNDLDYCGISVYSSTKKMEYLSCKMDIKTFLKNKNANENTPQIDRDIKIVLDSYQKSIEADIKRLDERKAQLDSLSGLLGTKSSNTIDDILESLMRDCGTVQLNAQLETLEQLRESFRNCVVSLCDAMGIKRKRKKICNKCGSAFKEDAKFCNKCGTSVYLGL